MILVLASSFIMVYFQLEAVYIGFVRLVVRIYGLLNKHVV